MQFHARGRRTLRPCASSLDDVIPAPLRGGACATPRGNPMVAQPNRGFTLIELTIVVAIIGILAAIAIPNFIAMQNRAKESGTKANMHTFQLAAEDYSVRNDGLYADTADDVALVLPSSGMNFTNPFDHSDPPWVDQPTRTVPMVSGSVVRGVIAYGDENRMLYQVVGRGSAGDLPVVLSSGQ
jgi:prepilin-type N-terminal cleavage/methylation domain-containing protein